MRGDLCLTNEEDSGPAACSANKAANEPQAKCAGEGYVSDLLIDELHRV